MLNNDSIPNTPSVPLQEENTDGNRTFNKEIKESELQERALDTSVEEIEEELDDSGFDMFGAVNKLMGGGF